MENSRRRSAACRGAIAAQLQWRRPSPRWRSNRCAIARPVACRAASAARVAAGPRPGAGEPRWILADEPLAALDLAHQLGLIAHFKSCAQAGQGVAVVLHDLAIAMNHADRVLVLERGRLVADGPPAAALAPAVIASVWGVQAHWLGEPGARALVARNPSAAGRVRG